MRESDYELLFIDVGAVASWGEMRPLGDKTNTSLTWELKLFPN